MDAPLINPQKDEVYTSIQEIFKNNPLLIVGTGSSCALSDRFGMKELASELLVKMPNLIRAFVAESNTWESIKTKLESGMVLESALKQVIISEPLLTLIAKITGDFVAGADQEIKLQCSRSKLAIPIENLICLLFNGLSDNQASLNIVTTNYDCLIEHCCDRQKIPVCTGFNGYIKKYYHWLEAKRQFDYIGRVKNKRIAKTKKHVKLYKLHGSIDWFKIDNKVFADTSLMYDGDIPRQVVVPGDSKYLETHKTPYSEIKEHANAAIRNANGFVFIGYGFNDIHIEDAIKNEIQQNRKPAIIITRDLGSNVTDILKQSPEFWAVFQDGDRTKITMNGIEKLTIPGQNAWQIDKFTKEVLGA